MVASYRDPCVTYLVALTFPPLVPIVTTPLDFLFEASSDSSVRESDRYDLVVAALCVVIGPGRRKDRMLDTVKELQLTSRAVCESCRRNACFHLNVERGTPRRLFPVVRDGRPLRSRGSQHIPAVHVVSLTWNRSARDLAGGLVLPPSLKTIVFGATFRGSVSDVYWPQRMEKLHFQSKFDRPLDKMKWPQSLRHLVLGRDFKQDVEDIPWPSDRDKMAFRSSFDQPIDSVPWPSMLRTLVITGRFNQPLGNVAFPATLRHLHLVTLFDHPIDEVRWPVGLRSLTFGVFNHPVEGVRWPEQLEHLTFIFEFNQPIKGVEWPPGLRVLRLGSAFNHPLDGVVWPGALRKLSIGVEFSYAINKYVLPERVEVERVTAKYDSLILSSLMD